MAKSPEKSLGSFVVERDLGEGGMGVVLLARHRTLDRPAVLKRLRRDLSSSPEQVERFEREARAAAAIHHQNVVAVYECFTWRSDLYIAQEYVDGVDIRTALSRSSRLPPRIATLILHEALGGLEEIHGRGTVHRDLKPANILLGRGGEVKIADFGIALERTGPALTQPGIMLGSPPYMSPEQIMGEPVDYRSDLFSLGVVLYEMLTGRPPFKLGGEDQPTLLTQIQKGIYSPVRKCVPGSPLYLRRIVRACLRANPRKRPRSAGHLRRLLQRRLGHPSPAGIRAELSRWLWEEGVFEEQTEATVLAPASTPPSQRLRWLPRRARAPLAFAVVLSLTLLVRSDSGPDGEEVEPPEPPSATADDTPEEGSDPEEK
jgi:serine/threonine-protein kinase